MGVFSRSNGPANKVNRNPFDLSFRNHLTTKFGQLTPVFCKEVIPGDSFKIDTRFGLQFMPTYFPVQTPMRVDIHYFYVRNRNLWKDWPDFIGKTKSGLVSPFLTSPKVYSSSLADYLGVPSTTASNIPLSLLSINAKGSSGYLQFNRYFSCQGFPVVSISGSWGSSYDLMNIDNEDEEFFGVLTDEFTATRSFCLNPTVTLPSLTLTPGKSSALPYEFRLCCALIRFDDTSNVPLESIGVYDFEEVTLPQGSSTFTFDSRTIDFHYISGSRLSPGDRCFLGFFFDRQVTSDGTARISANVPYVPYEITLVSDFVQGQYHVVDLSSSDLSDVFSSKKLPISALPFRAYESIYNAFYRDDRNNPRLVGGQPVYNDYLPTTSGGPDNTDYSLHFRNWEQDVFTSCVPTPQMGDAPLVGISSTGVMTFSDPDSGQSYVVQAKTADDADTIVGIDVKENLPTSVMRSLVNVATSGISINDFRNVNAFQRWKETNIRRGLKYRDQIKAHFDVDVKYAELDMPEFIGGVSQTVNVTKIDQTSAGSDSDPLGSFAGQAYAVGKSDNSVSQYCDEHGFIIGIMSVVPVPVYSQFIPKHFFKSDPFDYFFPEFGHIGLQPILNNEVAPIESFKDGKSEDVFGYQRAWYDYLSSVDECHGDFRLNLRDFLLGRTFTSTPTLGADFTVIDPNQLNNIFSYTLDTDKILGEIIFNVTALRPIPRFGVPKLESNV